MNKLKASGISLAAALGTVAGIAMLPGPGVTASFSAATSAVSDIVQHAVDKAAIVLLCTDCETGQVAAAGTTPQTAKGVEQDDPTSATDSSTPMALVVLAPQAGYLGGDAASSANDAGISEAGKMLPPPGSGDAENERAPAARSTIQADNGGSAPSQGSTTGTPSATGPLAVSCSMTPCEAAGPAEPPAPVPSSVSLPAGQVNGGEPPHSGIQPPGPPSTTPPRDVDPVLPDLAQAPVPDVANTLLPETTTPTPTPTERTVLTDEPHPVPEPATAALLGIGLAAFGWVSSRRRKQA